MKAKETIQHIINWLKEYSAKSKTNGYVIGISGGIDSAVVSTLCALTGTNTICVSLPIHQHKNEFDRAGQHLKWLEERYKNVTPLIVDLTKTFDTFSGTFPKEVQDHLTMANTRARLRMTTLYALAGHHKMLVCGTGNKIEDFGIGFFTKYGDGGVDLSPIGDLMKSEVYILAKELGIVSSIQTAAPTDGLFADGRSDADQIGASYDELEWAMNTIASGNFDENKFTERQKKVMEIYKQRHTANKHKMVPIPVCDIPAHLK